MNQRRSIHRNPAHKSRAHQLNQQRPKPHLNHMAANPPKNCPFFGLCPLDRSQYISQIIPGQNPRQGIQKLPQSRIFPGGPRKFSDVNLAPPAGNGISLHAAKRYGLDFVNAHSNLITLRGTSTPRKQKATTLATPASPSRRFLISIARENPRTIHSQMPRHCLPCVRLLCLRHHLRHPLTDHPPPPPPHLST